MQSCFLSEEALSVSPSINWSVSPAFLRNCKNSDNSGKVKKIHGQYLTFDLVCPCLVASYDFTKAITQHH